MASDTGLPGKGDETQSSPRGDTPSSRLSVPQKLEKAGRGYARLLWDYRLLFAVGALLFGLSLVLPMAPAGSNGIDFCNSIRLCSHGATPWGVATSIFLYDGWTNVPAYFGLLVAYAGLSDKAGQTERLKRARFGSIVIFVPALIANMLWIHFLPSAYTLGPSGVVYAMWGMMLAFTLFDGLPNHPTSIDPRTWYKDRKERSSAMGSLAFFGLTAFMLVSNPSGFLSAGPGVNVFAHGVSFLGGYCSAYVYRWTRGRGLWN